MRWPTRIITMPLGNKVKRYEGKKPPISQLGLAKNKSCDSSIISGEARVEGSDIDRIDSDRKKIGSRQLWPESSACRSRRGNGKEVIACYRETASHRAMARTVKSFTTPGWSAVPLALLLLTVRQRCR